MRWQWIILLVLAGLPLRLTAAETNIAPFLHQYCVDCHDAESRKGGLDLTGLTFDLKNPQIFSTWVRVHDRVAAGEMPPKKKARPDSAQLQVFDNEVSNALVHTEQFNRVVTGRATKRRLNRFEYEDTLRDLFSLPSLEVKGFLPEDSEAFGFNKVGDALDVSHVQMARYLAAADFALHRALAPQSDKPVKKIIRYHAWDQKALFSKMHLGGPLNRRTYPLLGLEMQTDLIAAGKDDVKRIKAAVDADPAQRKRESMALVVSTYEPTEIQFNEFRAPIAGMYRLTFAGYSVWLSKKFDSVTRGRRAEPVTIYADSPPRQLRKLGSFDVQPDSTTNSLIVWLEAGETIRPDAARFFRSRPPDFKNPLEEPGGMPAMAFQWMDAEGPNYTEWPPSGHKLMFGQFPTSNIDNKQPKGVEVISTEPASDSKYLLRQFMTQAYRRPLKEHEVDRFEGVIQSALKSGFSFTDAMIAGYTAVLSSPSFIYLQEKPGRLDDWALAERLSYFLWNSAPDEELRHLAERRKLHEPKILNQQTERLLSSRHSQQFVNAFLDYWLDLRLIAGTAPDAELYPDYQLDDLLLESMTAETQEFFARLVQRNMGISNLVDSDFAVLNERLATHYGIAGVQGVKLRPVKLTSDCVRGGLLTQASILKVTANGTTTSPVKRGAWIMARVLGRPPPPPPPNIPAVEPDTRGATTMREQLAKHRSQESCAACHRNIDPAGFALESFDVMGAYRDQYRAVGNGLKVRGVGHNGLIYAFSLGLKVDPSGELPDGRAFQNIAELKHELLADQEQLARNLLRQLTIYATGAPIGFSDRPEIERMLAESRKSGYGVRTLIHEVVNSELFLNK